MNKESSGIDLVAVNKTPFVGGRVAIQATKGIITTSGFTSAARPAVLWLQDNIGLPQALASQRLQTDGAEVVWDFGRRSNDPADQDIVDGSSRGSVLRRTWPSH